MHMTRYLAASAAVFVFIFVFEFLGTAGCSPGFILGDAVPAAAARARLVREPHLSAPALIRVERPAE